MRYFFPGSFDPPTVGHRDLICRAAALCDELIVVIMENHVKNNRYPAEVRREMLRRITKDLPNVTIEIHEGMLVDFAKKVCADAVVRGIRNEQDYAYERDMACYNRDLGDIETVFLQARPELSVVSSSGVREILHFGKNADRYVPQEILDLL